MFKRIAIALFLGFCFIDGFSQATMEQTDAKTYALYLEGNWKQLIEEGNKALKQGIDFYYLRYRMGISYYSLKNYRKALMHFEKAYKIDNSDMLLAEYLYFSYLFSDREMDATAFQKQMQNQLKKKLNIDTNQFFQSIDVNYAVSNLINDDILTAQKIESQLATSEQGLIELSKGFTTFNAGIQHKIVNKLNAYHQFTNLDKRNWVYTRDEFASNVDEDRQVLQNQYYFLLKYLPVKGLEFDLAAHTLFITYYTEKITVGKQGGQKKMLVADKSSEIIYDLGLNKHFGKFVFSGNLAYSNFIDQSQWQYDAAFTYYPLGNLDFYTKGGISFLDTRELNSFIFQERIGIGIRELVWLELSGFQGEANPFFFNNASIVFNGNETIRKMYSTSLIVPLSKGKFLINAGYFHNQYDVHFWEFQKGELEKTFRLKHQLINGGITWKL